MSTMAPALGNDTLDALLHARTPVGWGGLFHGVHTALVTDLRDPDSQGRVKVRLPWLPDSAGAACELWARLSTLMCGSNRGSWFIPDVDDEVLVMFEHGDINRPLVVSPLGVKLCRPSETVKELLPPEMSALRSSMRPAVTAVAVMRPSIGARISV